MNFSKLSKVLLSTNPVQELDSKQLSFISGGCGCGHSIKTPKVKKVKHHKSSSSSSS